MNRRFTLTDKGTLHWMLGIKITRDLDAATITLSQSLYISDLVSRFAPYIQAKHTRSYSSPLEEGFRLHKSDQPSLDSDEYERMAPLRSTYMSLVGGLIWAATMTRHEISFSVSQLARALTNPGQKHFDAAIRVLIYLDATKDAALVYKPNPTHSICGLR